MAVYLHSLTARLGVEVGDLTPAHLQQLCDLQIPEAMDVVSGAAALALGGTRNLVGSVASPPRAASI
jgi:hypothetical protein